MKTYLVFSLLLEKWPVENFGTLMSNFHAEESDIARDTFESWSTAIFDQKPNMNQTGSLERFPLPGALLRLLSVNNEGLKSGEWKMINPTLLDGLDPVTMLRLMKYRIWMDYELRNGRNSSDLILDELSKYNFTRKTDIKVY